MTYAKPKRRLLSSSLALTLLPALSFGGVTLSSSVAEAAVKKANCRVSSVLASKEESASRIPGELKFLKEQLEDDRLLDRLRVQLLEVRLDPATLLDRAVLFRGESHRLLEDPGKIVGVPVPGLDGDRFPLLIKILDATVQTNVYAFLLKPVSILLALCSRFASSSGANTASTDIT